MNLIGEREKGIIASTRPVLLRLLENAKHPQVPLEKAWLPRVDAGLSRIE